ncbi:MAG: adenosine deaminase [Planctomycetes bacterium]|nr:adenosine deaminase [Planctomycetota bacterium]
MSQAAPAKQPIVPRPESIPPELKAIAKVELHQHVDGSIPVSVTWGLMQQHGLAPVATEAEMRRLLVLQREEEGTGLLKYLDKFHYPLWVTQFWDNIADVAYSIAKEAYEEGVRILEIRYAPIIHVYAGLTPRQAIVSLLEGLNRAENDFEGLTCGVIVIAMRHMGPHIAKIVARQAIAESQMLHSRVGVVGFDIAGAERGNPPKLFKQAFDIARRGGLGLTAHAGEDMGPEAVWQAVDELGVQRIGHGCSAIRDKDLLRRLARDQVLIEVCQTSNYQTAAVKPGERHPVYTFLEHGVPVAICTDNTTVSDTSQLNENALLAPHLSTAEIAGIHDRARAHSFIPSDRRRL